MNEALTLCLPQQPGAQTTWPKYNYENSFAAKFFSIVPANWRETTPRAGSSSAPGEVQLSVGNT